MYWSDIMALYKLQAITWTIIDLDFKCHVPLLGHKEGKWCVY